MADFQHTSEKAPQTMRCDRPAGRYQSLKKDDRAKRSIRTQRHKRKNGGGGAGDTVTNNCTSHDEKRIVFASLTETKIMMVLLRLMHV